MRTVLVYNSRYDRVMLGSSGSQPDRSPSATVVVGAHEGHESAITSLRDADVPDEPPLSPGSRLDRFEILELLGEGGMGRVYRAHDPKLRRDVAIKLLRRRDAEARLLREARAMARLDHPNLLPIFGVGQFPEGSCIIMELVQGQTLGEWL